MKQTDAGKDSTDKETLHELSYRPPPGGGVENFVRVFSASRSVRNTASGSRPVRGTLVIVE
ncbi:MAG: hypothetical protein M3461_06230 [Pseudomonadota bacterium]|nr:hypothetical protein [Pseudomonadota bacterium]